ncbi:MAG TPA: hypothetical protein VNG31_04040 [Candidatus Baltobacteraceae bacterium]|nr:hypothetical protein [Candidatus Baltobacteraceae bacterium]
MAAWICKAALASLLALSAVTVYDYGSLQQWFALQPGSHLLSKRITDPNAGFAAPKAPDGLLAQPPTSGGWSDGVTTLRGYYDPAGDTAMVSVSGAQVNGAILTRIKSVPSGLPTAAIDAATRNGVRLGMSRTQVSAIEGPPTVLQFPDHKVYTYDWPGERLAFWFVDHKVAAIELLRR